MLGSFFGVTKLPGLLLQRKLEARLEEVAMGAGSEPDGRRYAEGDAVKVHEGGPMPGFDRFVSGTTRGSALGRWIEQSGVKTSFSAVLLIALALAAVVGFLTDDARQGARGASCSAAIVGFALPFWFLNIEARQAAAHVRGRVSRSARPHLPGRSRPATRSSPA